MSNAHVHPVFSALLDDMGRIHGITSSDKGIGPESTGRERTSREDIVVTPLPAGFPVEKEATEKESDHVR